MMPKICRSSSQKYNEIRHKQGINEVNELNNLRAFVNVILFLRTRMSDIQPIVNYLYF